jgi:hypothetical protein
MLGFLKANFEHFSPVQVMADSCEITSSRVEGFFGHYKNLTGHEVLPLALAAKGIRLLAAIILKAESAQLTDEATKRPSRHFNCR